jgi:hypothetical protein
VKDFLRIPETPKIIFHIVFFSKERGKRKLNENKFKVMQFNKLWGIFKWVKDNLCSKNLALRMRCESC